MRRTAQLPRETAIALPVIFRLLRDLSGAQTPREIQDLVAYC
jgi:hypothetical protein